MHAAGIMTDPFRIVIINGSPSKPSRTAALTQHIERRLSRGAYRLRNIAIRDLPAEALLHARADDRAVAEALQLVADADGVIVASPVYKAAYTGALKTFLDLLPQFGLRGKAVLPLLTGGSLAHVLALDYALRPVLQSLDARVIVNGLFVLDKWINVDAEGQASFDNDIVPRIEAVTQAFIDAIHVYAQA
jgi:FMN reductase